MRISFELDDTLFEDGNQVKAEPLLPFPFRMIYKECLRLGALELMNKIREQGMLGDGNILV